MTKDGCHKPNDGKQAKGQNIEKPKQSRRWVKARRRVRKNLLER